MNRPDSYYSANNEEGSGSLLNSTSTLHDEKINALLYDRIKLPKQIRIAILKMSKDNYWRFYSSDFTQLNDSISRSLIDKLRSSPRVYDASFLPAMLVPEKRTVPVLREAAARFQSDLLLAYRSSCNSYQKHRFISPDETRSYCSVETVLLDIRKGIVGKSVVTTQEFNAVKKTSDTNFGETIKKSELEALSKALGEIADEVVNYLNTVPLLDKNL
jgi:hypothetical protein